VPQYDFNFIGQQSVDQFFTDAFDNDASARAYAQLLADSFRITMPDVCEGSYIALTRDGRTIAHFLLSAAH